MSSAGPYPKRIACRLCDKWLADRITATSVKFRRAGIVAQGGAIVHECPGCGAANVINCVDTDALATRVLDAMAV